MAIRAVLLLLCTSRVESLQTEQTRFVESLDQSSFPDIAELGNTLKDGVVELLPTDFQNPLADFNEESFENQILSMSPEQFERERLRTPEEIQATVDTHVQAIGAEGAKIGDAFSTDIIQVGEGISKMVPDDLIEQVDETVQEVFENVSMAAQQVHSQASEMVDGVTDQVTEVGKTFVVDTANAIKTASEATIPSPIVVAKTLEQGLTTVGQEVATQVDEIGTQLMDQVTDITKDMPMNVDDLSHLADDVVVNVGKVAQDAAESMPSMDEVEKEMTSATDDLAKGMAEQVDQLSDTVDQSVSDLSDQMSDQMKALVEDTEVQSDIAAAAQEQDTLPDFNDITKSFKEGMDQVTKQISDAIPAEVGEAVSQASDLSITVQDQIPAALEQFGPSLLQLGSALQDGFQTVSQGISSMVPPDMMQQAGSTNDGMNFLSRQ